MWTGRVLIKDLLQGDMPRCLYIDIYLKISQNASRTCSLVQHALHLWSYSVLVLPLLFLLLDQLPSQIYFNCTHRMVHRLLISHQKRFYERTLVSLTNGRSTGMYFRATAFFTCASMGSQHPCCLEAAFWFAASPLLGLQVGKTQPYLPE